MSKKKIKTKPTIKCMCTRCDQVAFAQEGTTHQYCRGIHPNIVAMLPDSMKDLTNPTKKGTWAQWVEPKKVEPIQQDQPEELTA